MKQKILNWYEAEIQKDKTELNKEKNDFINKIKQHKKQDIVTDKKEKLTIWQRIKKVLTNT